MTEPSITDEYTRRGIDAVHLENRGLRVEVLAGKGGDVTEIRDKRTDTNVLFESPHEWHAPRDAYAGAPDPTFSFLDHYPGGWQDVIPAAGGPASVAGATFGLHGESTTAPWEATILHDDEDAVSVQLSLSLTRYPLDVERTITLADDPVLTVEETVTNRGEVSVEYAWLQHVAFGPPLVGPDARLEVPCETVLVDPDHDPPNARLPPGETFEWPTCDLDDGTVDLRRIPPKDARVHDLVALTDLAEGRYTLVNPELDLATTVRFPADLFEYLWYWQAFGGFEEAPFFGRNYSAGLEPCTSIPNAGLERAIENGTANTLAAGEREHATIEVEVAPADRVPAT